MENFQNKSNTLNSAFQSAKRGCRQSKFSEGQTQQYSLNFKKQSVGIRIRHPFICAKCRRFKIQGFHGSFPPKNFCICSNEIQNHSNCMSPIQLRIPSAPPKNLIATGVGVYNNKLNEFSLTDSTLAKLSTILGRTKTKIILDDSQIESIPIDSESFIQEKDKEKDTEIEKEKEKFRYLIYPGNNSKLIREIMSKKNN